MRNQTFCQHKLRIDKDLSKTRRFLRGQGGEKNQSDRIAAFVVQGRSQTVKRPNGGNCKPAFGLVRTANKVCTNCISSAFDCQIDTSVITQENYGGCHFGTNPGARQNAVKCLES
jgi:hypothetical protein